MLSKKEIAEGNIFVRKDGSYARWNNKTLSWEKVSDPPKPKRYRFYCFICERKIDNIGAKRIYKKENYPPEARWCCQCKRVWEYYAKYKDKFDKFIIKESGMVLLDNIVSFL